MADTAASRWCLHIELLHHRRPSTPPPASRLQAQTYDLAAAYRRAEAWEKQALDARAKLEQAHQATRVAQEEAGKQTAAAAEQVRVSEEARGEAERRLAEAHHANDALQRQLDALLAGSGSEGTAQLPLAPTGEEWGVQGATTWRRLLCSLTFPLSSIWFPTK
jgi:hypothetical protein